jgi:hypothetical protein
MTTTPNEPAQDPAVVPSGDPGVGPDEETGSPAEEIDFPATDPEAEPGPEAQPGQMPEDTNTEVGA